MIKAIGILGVCFCMFSCNTDSLDGFYYDFKSDRVFHFDRKASNIFYLKDSLNDPFDYNIIDENVLEINGIDYSYQKYSDSLVLFNYEQYRLTLEPFEFQEIPIEDLMSTSWKHDTNKIPNSHKIKQLEDVSFNFKRDKTLMIQLNKDSLSRLTYIYTDKYFDKFLSFKSPERHSHIVPIQLKTDTLKILITGNSYPIYTLYKLKSE